jgi:hypothetical protein
MFSPSRAFLPSFGLVVLSLGLANPLFAQGPGCCAPAPCAPATCCAPVTCCAPPPPPDVCTCTTYKPVCETCYHQQPIMTYRDVCRTCYRQEPYCVTVPVTKIDCITCDEGCYKMVWCPRIVTKQVPRTEYRQQMCCRTVPYTVTQRVPQVMMQTVPEYRVRYCPETHTYIKPPCNPCPCCPMPCAPSCAGPAPYLGQATPASPLTQAIATAPPAQPQQPPVTTAPVQLAPVPQSAAPESIAAAGNDSTDAYLRARSAANVWQASHTPTAQ